MVMSTSISVFFKLIVVERVRAFFQLDNIFVTGMIVLILVTSIISSNSSRKLSFGLAPPHISTLS